MSGPSVQMRSFVEVLRERADRRPDDPAYRFLPTGAGEGTGLTYGELELRARRVAARVQELGWRGERVVLLFPAGLEYVTAFWGCLLAGAVAVPAYPPRGRRSLPRLEAMLSDAEPAGILAPRAQVERVRRLLAGERRLGVEAVDELPEGLEAAWRDPGVDGETVAFLQYTSGSTSTPKGVVLTHRNLLENQEMIRRAFGTSPDSVVVSWLPLYHDMGLIGGMLHPLFVGARCVLMPPVGFLQAPIRWLRAISHYRASVSGAPNFAYELCARRAGEAADDRELEGLDLSSWRVAFNGAEPVRAETLERFERAFGRFGFRRRSWYPCYGLAEATLLVSAGRPEPGPVVRQLDAAALETHRVAWSPVGEEGAGAPHVGCGSIAHGLEVRIVDPERRVPLEPGAVGEIWVAGAGVAAGYWRRPVETAETFGGALAGPADGAAARHLRTGDLGFLADGELYVTGRIKDLIVVRGRNLYPQDLEAAMESAHPALRAAAGAAFSVPVDGQERVVLVHEIEARRQTGEAEAADVLRAIRRDVVDRFEVPPRSVTLLRAGSLPRTTSGKVRRRECRRRYLAGELDAVAVWDESEGSTGATDGAVVAPRSQREAAVREIWAEVLGLHPDRIGVDRHFFELGGNSVQAGRLIARLRAVLGVELAMEEVFDSPTVAEMAAQIDDGGRPDAPPERIPRAGDGSEWPTTAAQSRLWFLDRLAPGNPAYNLSLALEWRGPHRPAPFARALRSLVVRHEALRTVLRVVDEEPRQVVLDHRRAVLGVVDLQGLEPRSATREALRLERWQGRQPFALAEDLAPRLSLLRLSPERMRAVLTVHHAVSDAWSLGVLVRELVMLYEAETAGAAATTLPELPIRLGDYAAWRRRRDEAAVEAQMAHWRRELAGPVPVLELPTDRPRPPVLGYDGAVHEEPLPLSLVAVLEPFARRRGASLFMVLLAGLRALFLRYTGAEDAVIGTAIADRQHAALEPLVGLLVDTLPLRLRAARGTTFQRLLANVRRTTLDALAHREVPFERLVESFAPERDRSRRPLVQAMMVLQNAPFDVPRPEGVELTVREVDNGTARFDLALSWLPGPAGPTGCWKYDRALFDPSSIGRMAAHLRRLLEAAIERPELPLAALPLLSAAERQQTLREWNDTGAVYEGAADLAQRLRDQALRTPDAIAVVYEHLSVSYRELARRTAEVAAGLRARGIGCESRVGVRMERSVDLVVALHGVVSAGAAYVPLDPSYPADRVAYMARDAQLSTILVDADGGSPTTEPGLTLEELRRDSRQRLEIEVPPESLAYVLYTSGSTGRPKGAGVSHRAIVNRLSWMQEAYSIDAGDTVLQKTPYSFDVSVWELFWASMVGARLVVARPGLQGDGAYLADVVARERVTTIHFVPSMLQAFVSEPRLHELRDLRRVIASGEALPPDLARRFLARSPAELHNLYGPTEAAVDVTAWRCRTEATEPTVPLGRPIGNLRIHGVDPDGRAVPPGVAGELRIAGAGLGRGYHRRPALTAARFVPDPFALRPGERQYRTGDLTRRCADGTLEFLGRLDHQVKVRGFRIELGEIEEALRQVPGVRDAVAAAPPGESGPRLTAWIVAAAAEDGAEVAEPDAERLSAALREVLPPFMVPSAFVVLPELPRTPSGKIDRSALPEPTTSKPDRDLRPRPPRTAVERRLTALWADQLGGVEPGPHDDFFALGGDSVQGALLVNRLQRELDAVVYVMALFEHPTLAAFASYLEASYPDALAAAGWTSTPGLRDVETDEGPVGEGHVDVMERHLAALFPSATGVAGREPKNPRAVFLLSPFRSGSTLLRVMLAGHPQLFAPPELELLGFETMAQRAAAFDGARSFAGEGLLRALMELHGGDAEAAAERVAAHSSDTTRTFYRRLQEWIGPGRLLVDKTPRYALDRATLARAESWFDEPLYIHLLRHPCGTIHSYGEARMDQVYGFPYSPARQAELVWWISHRNVREALATVPAERRCEVRFEDLVRDPRGAMEALSEFLGVAFVPEMLQPYAGERMTDGIADGGRMMGDPRFHRHREIDPTVAERWRGEVAADRLGDATRRLAADLGYSVSGSTLEPVETIAREGDLPLSAGQRRLWFLDRLDEGGAVYNMPAVVALRGRLEPSALARTFAEVTRRHEVLRSVFPAAGGRPSLVLRAPSRPPLPVIDLSGLGPAIRSAESRRLAVLEARRPFDLAAGPLLRLALLRHVADDHTLLVTLHHAVSDGWSIGLLLREVTALYAAFAAGRPSPLPELPVQYVDYAHWQRRRLEGPALAAASEYWRERLAEPRSVLELPADRPRPAVRSNRGGRRPVRLSGSAAASVAALARRLRTTPFLVLLSAFQAVLHRHSGQQDLWLGTPVWNRPRLELESLVGFFVNTLVLRTTIEPEIRFQDLIERARATFVSASRHEEMPFERLVEELGVDRSLSHPPLVQAMFSFQRLPARRLELPGLTVEVAEVETGTSKLDLLLSLFEDEAGGGLEGFLEYDAELFDRTTVDRLGGHLEILLTAAARAPDRALADLPLWTAAERQQAIVEWNDTGAPAPASPILHDLLRDRAEHAPDAVAVVAEEGVLTFRGLAVRVEALAARLRTAGVGPEVRVGVLAERSLDLVIALHGVVAAGGAYVPLDPSYPAERLAFMAADADLRAILVPRGLRDRVPASGARILELGGTRATAPVDAPPPPRPPEPEALAYAIYTSGSTGRPKGVGISQAAIVNRLVWMQRAHRLGPDDALLQKTPYSFDVSVWELFWPAIAGARLVVARPGAHGDPDYLARTIADERVTTLHFVPSMLHTFLAAPELERLVTLRRVFASGEALPADLAARFLARSSAALHNLYGPTEAAVEVTAWTCALGETTVPIGRPIDELRVHCVDARGSVVPTGVPGELRIAGAGLARGYLGRPALTAERFVPDDYAQSAGARQYRTGDLVRRRPDGALEFLGRLDHQVKIRGFRIELGEVEAVLAEHSEVAEAVVKEWRGSGGDARLVAYLTATGATGPSVETLRRHVAEHLPGHMMPTRFILLDELPTTPSGKIDRSALPDPEPERPTLQTPHVAPASALERRIARIWCEVLRIDEAGVHDNFFDLGGHSLLAAEVHGRLREELAADLTLVEAFQYPTIHALARRMEMSDGEPVTQAQRQEARKAASATRKAKSARQARRRRVARK